MSNGLLYGLARVRVVSFAEHDPSVLRPDISAPYPIDYDIGVGAALDEAQSEVDVTVTLGVDAVPQRAETDDEGRFRLADLVASCTYHLGDIDGLRVDGRVRISGLDMALLVGITLSTTRGLLVGRSRLRILSDAPLPVLTPREVVQDLAQRGDWIDTFPDGAHD